MSTIRRTALANVSALIAAALLVWSAVVVRAAAADATVSVEQRERLLHRLHALHESCRSGRLPDPVELDEVGALFGDERLLAVCIDGACYLTFAEYEQHVDSHLLFAASPR